MGLINSKMQTPPAPAQAPMQAPSQAGGNLTNAVHRVVAAGAKLLYNEAISKNVVNMVRSDQTAVAGVAHAALFLMAQMVKLSKNSMPAGAKVPALKELTVLIAELAQHAGVIQGDIKPIIVAARRLIASGIGSANKIQPNPTMKPSMAHPPFIQR